MDLRNIFDSKIGGAIDTQFKTNIAFERIENAIHGTSNGLAGFLSTLDFIGNILTILLALFIITVLLIIWIVKKGVFFYYWIRK
ncbi:hypothetical protein FRY74_06130 [Vicingus serpentipes]|uniref:Uncharacterized protein n=1 Tax=Vicingus serpentipes TaxID=1926625 RepID=A0A5C6RVM2_9FLAO|nr:hypothetical protein [Vicingus serpentipes]TXB66147.1 hypothetical protein FRY74_06130 [Vicingus serpentipes]